MSANPTMTCKTCKRERDCMLHMRGFPPEGAKRWLRKTCETPRGDDGQDRCDFTYTAGWRLPVIEKQEPKQ